MDLQKTLAKAEHFYEAGLLQQSEALCHQVINAQGDSHAAYFQLALIAVKANILPRAVTLMLKALELSPAKFIYHRSLCEMYRRVGQSANAIAYGRRAVMLAPVDAECHYNLGLALASVEQYSDAVDCYCKALELNTRHGFAANNLGSALEKMGDEKAAEGAYRRAVEIDCRNAEAQNNLGAILSAQGDLKAAGKCFEAAIDAAPQFVFAHCNLSTIKKYTPDDPHLAILEGLLQHEATMGSEVRIKFWFAISKVWADIKQHEKAMKGYHKANRLMRATFTYDEFQTRSLVSDIVDRFDSKIAKKQSNCDDPTPIFILGMPRSGTTLIEQIISSHSQVHGAGELRCFSETVTECLGASPNVPYMDWLLNARPDDLTKLGKRYVEKLREGRPATPFITDKMPGNFFFAGLIRMALPNAKIIHSMRDPIDTCLSNYQILFKDTMPFAYDQTDLARYYSLYHQLTNHWQNILPKNSILNVRYEDVVSDLEGQARRMLDYCDLEWEPSCLQFHKNDRLVKTASISQVRQPLYKTSVSRWKPYKSWLAPLIDGLRDVNT